MSDTADHRICTGHSDREADFICARCGGFLCRDCLWDIVFLHCEPCASLYLQTVTLPPRPITYRAYTIAGALFLIVVCGVISWFMGQSRSVESAFFPALVCGFIISQLTIRIARDYRLGFRKNKGRDLFKADYTGLMEEFKGKLMDIEVPDMSSLFQIDFEALNLEEKLDLIREFCRAMDRLPDAD